MDIQTRKIAFVQEFLKLQSEKTISRLENVLKTEKQTFEKSEVLDGIKQAVKEMNLVKEGKLKARDAKELINEL